jgi:hypothetical protein
MNRVNKQTWIWFSVLLVIFIVINYFAFSLKPKQYPPYLAESPAPDGVKAIFTYLDKKIGSERWNASPNQLPKSNQNKLLIMVEPTIPDEKEMDAYLKFLQAGNTIFLLKDNPKGMFDLSTVPKGAPKGNTVKVYDSKNKSFTAEISSTVRIVPKKDDSILLEDKGGVAAVKRKVGKGEIIVSLTPEWMTNDRLLKKDHLPLVLQLLSERPSKTILFDEYLHGSQTASNQLFVYPKWFLLLFLQGVILLILWLWQKGKRFGPIFVPREESVRFSDEGIRALSAWYLRGSRYQDSLMIQADYVKHLLQERWGIPLGRNWTELEGLFERKKLRLRNEGIHSFITGLVQVLAKEKISKQEYLLWSKKLDQLRKEVEQG